MTTALPGRLTLREVARPAMVAYEIIATQQRQAAPLVAEAQDLLKTADELLRQLGMAQLLAAPVALGDPTDKDDQAARLTAAYSAAGLAWARLIAHVATLAEHHAANRQFARASELVEVISAAGEPDAANRLHAAVTGCVGALVESVGPAHYDRSARASVADIRSRFDRLMSVLNDLDGTKYYSEAMDAVVRGQLGVAVAAISAKIGEIYPNAFRTTHSWDLSSQEQAVQTASTRLNGMYVYYNSVTVESRVRRQSVEAVRGQVLEIVANLHMDSKEPRHA